ncbi:MAG: hypothetical protein MUF15_11980 [Acidobacteria bacterium]|nr:hypothetical protein [Acidobacteriota bacterium]
MIYKIRVFFILFLIIFNRTGWATGVPVHFYDDFEKGSAKWDFLNPDHIEIKDSGDPKHGKILCLHSGGPGVYALVKNSQGWTNYKIEGDVYFPYYFYHYLGLIYNYNASGGRVDFGSIFLLGPYGEEYDEYFSKYRDNMEFQPDEFIGNIIQPNPHRDSNASRVLYSEYWVSLKGESAVKPGEWHHFKGEVFGPVCHFYVDDMNTPKITYEYFEYASGRVGFKPRFAGSQSWVDNVTITPIKELSYKGNALPDGRNYEPDKLITHWDVLGPFHRRMKEIEEQGFQKEKLFDYQNKKLPWKPFESDPRGCVVTGKVLERFSGRTYGYFHTELISKEREEMLLQFSSSNSMVLWINNRLIGTVNAQFAPWYDSWYNPKHKGDKFTITLEPGVNHIMLLVKGGRYGGDGFYAHIGPAEVEE